jgi:hypothetical protein
MIAWRFARLKTACDEGGVGYAWPAPAVRSGEETNQGRELRRTIPHRILAAPGHQRTGTP